MRPIWRCVTYSIRGTRIERDRPSEPQRRYWKPTARRMAAAPNRQTCRRCERCSLAILRCQVYSITRAGDHELVVGEVVDFEGSGGEPLIFHRGAFGGLDADALVARGRVIGFAGAGW